MVITKLLDNTQEFTDLDKQIANFFLTEKIQIKNMSTRDIASILFTTPSKIVRFCQKIGFQGFSEFKKLYIEEIKSDLQSIDYNFPFEANDKTLQLSTKIASLYHQHINEVINYLNHDSLNKALKLLANKTNIIVISSGVQVDIAKIFQDHMLKIGANVIVESQMDQAYYRANHANETTVFLVISYSGQTPSTLKVAHLIKKRKLPLIALTAQGDSPLALISDVVLHLSTHETLIENLGHFGTNISTMLLLDILYAQYFNLNYNKNLEKRVKVTSSFQTHRSSSNPILKD